MQPDGTRPGRDRLSKRGERQERVRQAEYAARLARWQHVERVLVQAEHLVLALGAQGERRPADPALPMRPAERVLAVLPALVLVEASRPAGVAGPEYARYGARVAAALAFRRPALPAEPQRVRGHGAVTVTSQRVLFHGSNAVTQWPYQRLMLVEHATGRPVSLLHLAGESTVYGLLSRPQDAARVRLLIEYGLAAYAGDVHRLLVGLSVEHRLHALDQPTPPRQRVDRPGPPGGEPGTAVGSAAARDGGEPTRTGPGATARGGRSVQRSGPAARDDGAASRDGGEPTLTGPGAIAHGGRPVQRGGPAARDDRAAGRDGGEPTRTGLDATARGGRSVQRNGPAAGNGGAAGRPAAGRNCRTAGQRATTPVGAAAGRRAAGRVIRAARAPIDEPGPRTAPTAFERVREVLRTALPALRPVPRRAVLAGIWVVGIAVLAASGTTQAMLASMPHPTRADAAPGRPGALTDPAVSTSPATQDEAAPPVEPEAEVSGQPVPSATAVMSASPPRTTTTPTHRTTPQAQTTRPRWPATTLPRLPAKAATPTVPRPHSPRARSPHATRPSYLR